MTLLDTIRHSLQNICWVDNIPNKITVNNNATGYEKIYNGINELCS